MAQQLPWIRYNTSTPSHPKMLELVADEQWQAIAVWHFGLAYCGLHSMSGYIPYLALPQMHGDEKAASVLVSVGLWEVAVNGWQIHNWALANLEDADSIKRKERAQRAANKRWHPERFQ